MKKIFTLCLAIAGFVRGNGQVNLPTVVPPPTLPMQFQKYGDYPVSYYTGVPDITIPLLTIKQGDIELPITMSYHASGIKVNDPSGFFGIGWTLNTGGMISVTVKGTADLSNAQYSPMPQASELDPTTNRNFLTFLRAQDNDDGANPGGGPSYNTENDIFSYEYGSEFGKFALKADGTAFMMPYKPLKITLTNWKSAFDIVDDKGFTRRFGSSPDGIHGGINGNGLSSGDGWPLAELMSAKDTNSRIAIRYGKTAVQQMYLRSDQILYDDFCTDATVYDPDGNGLPAWMYLDPAPELTTTVQTIGSSAILPTQMDFTNGHVSFSYDGTTNMLTEIDQYNSGGQLIQTIRFTIIPFANQTTRYKLAGIQFYDSQGSLVNQYKFSYHEGSVMPVAGSGVDYWGYWNNDDANYSMVPQYTNFWREPAGSGSPAYGTIGHANRSSNLSAMQTYTLDTIHYPTGGYTSFDFETNQYYDQGQGMYVNAGGLRIQAITSFSADGKQQGKKTYTYAGDYIEVLPTMDKFNYSTMMNVVGTFYNDLNGLEEGYSFRRSIFSSDANVDLSPNGSPVIYSEVTETYGDNADNIGSITYEYDLNNRVYGVMDTNGDQAGFGNLFPVQNKPYLEYIDDWNHQGNLLSKSIQKTDGSVQTINYGYTRRQRDTLMNFTSYRFCINQMSPYADYSGQAIDVDQFTMNDFIAYKLFNYVNYYLVSGEVRLTSQQTLTYGGDYGGLSIATENYTYGNDDNIQVTQKTTNNSIGDLITTNYSYPADLQNSGSPNIYNEMMDRHMWSVPVQQSTYKNTSTFLESNRTTYQDWGSGMIAPLTVDTKKGTGDYVTRIQYSAYDALGNIQTVAKVGDTKHTYIWGYNNMYPVAEVVNADYATASQYVNMSVIENPSSDQALRDEVNKIRTALGAQGVLVTTYTYTPLVGVTSITDPRGVTSYYDYDAANRLARIRDLNQNILKSFCYDYFGQAASCAAEGPPNWQLTYNAMYAPCPANPAYTAEAQVEEKDMNPSSGTYGQTRWIDATPEIMLSGTFHYENSPSPPTYTPTQTFQCVNDQFGYHTGYQQQLYVSANPCSGGSEWVNLGQNLGACPLNQSYSSPDETGYYYSQNCTSPYAPDPVYVSIPGGMFTSTVSFDDAITQAVNYGQNIANQQGTCSLPPVDLTVNCDGSDEYEIDLSNTTTGDFFTFYVHQGDNQFLQTIPGGVYNIQISGFSNTFIYSNVGCGQEDDDYYPYYEGIVLGGDNCNYINIW